MISLDHYVKGSHKCHTRKFDENATMSFIVKDKQLLKKYTKIWEAI